MRARTCAQVDARTGHARREDVLPVPHGSARRAAACLVLGLAPVLAAAAPAYQGMSAIASANNADVTVTLPPHEAGDVFLMLARVRDVDDTATVSGWIQLATFDRGTTTTRGVDRGASGAANGFTQSTAAPSPSVGLLGSDGIDARPGWACARLVSTRGA